MDDYTQQFDDSALTQNNRVGRLATAMGPDVLALVQFRGSEALSEPFLFQVDAISENPNIDFDGAIGKPASVTLMTYGKQREFNGLLVEAQSTGLSGDGKYFGYQVVMRPWFWLLTKTSDCRVFHEKKVPEIIEKVFHDRGFGRGKDYELNLTDGDYPQREYTVQYRESDFNFVSRLMEKEGICYYFLFEDGNHKMILADSITSHSPVPNLPKVPFHPAQGNFVRQGERITEWYLTRQFRSGKFELNDYNYEKPNANLLSDAQASEKYARSNMERYDYPGMYKEQSVGERYAKIALEAEQAADHRRYGKGEAVSLFPGGLTRLMYYPDRRQPIASENIEYLVVRTSHSFGTQHYRTIGQSADPEAYHGTYELQPSSRPFRAPIVTPAPRIHGIQTAKVVTKTEGGGEEIDVEKL